MIENIWFQFQTQNAFDFVSFGAFLKKSVDDYRQFFGL